VLENKMADKLQQPAEREERKTLSEIEQHHRYGNGNYRHPEKVRQTAAQRLMLAAIVLEMGFNGCEHPRLLAW
jgi:hypothetical protein